MRRCDIVNGIPAVKLKCFVVEVVCPQIGDIYEEYFEMFLWKTWDNEYYAFSQPNRIYWNIKERAIKVINESFPYECSGGKNHKKMMRRNRVRKLHHASDMLF